MNPTTNEGEHSTGRSHPIPLPPDSCTCESTYKFSTESNFVRLPKGWICAGCGDYREDPREGESSIGYAFSEVSYYERKPLSDRRAEELIPALIETIERLEWEVSKAKAVTRSLIRQFEIRTLVRDGRVIVFDDEE